MALFLCITHIHTTGHITIFNFTGTIIRPSQNNIHGKITPISKKLALFIGGSIVRDLAPGGGCDSRYPVGGPINTEISIRTTTNTKNLP